MKARQGGILALGGKDAARFPSGKGMALRLEQTVRTMP